MKRDGFLLFEQQQQKQKRKQVVDIWFSFSQHPTLGSWRFAKGKNRNLLGSYAALSAVIITVQVPTSAKLLSSNI